MNFHSRHYQNASDLEKMIALLTTIRPPAWRKDYPDATDLREIMANSDIHDNTMLWFDAEKQLLGFAYVDTNGILRFELHSACFTTQVESQVFEFANQIMSEMGHSHLYTNSRLEDKRRVQALEKHGFTMTSNRTLTFSYDLSQPTRTATLPAGFHIRAINGDTEVEAVVSLHQAAFGTSYMTIDERRNMMSNPDYDPALDLVIVAPDGQIAGYCFCLISSETGTQSGKPEGFIDVIATHPDFQQRGLAKALILTALELFKQRELSHAILGTSSQNEAMRQLAQTLGFTISYERVWFERAIQQS